MDIDPLIISIVGITVTVIGLMLNYFKFLGDMRKDIDIKIDCIDKKHNDTCEKILKQADVNGNRLTAIEIKTDLFWKSIENEVIRTLIHPNCERRDTLLIKFKHDDISTEELRELSKDLITVTTDTSVNRKSTESMAATLLLGRIAQILFDRHIKVRVV